MHLSLCQSCKVGLLLFYGKDTDVIHIKYYKLNTVIFSDLSQNEGVLFSPGFSRPNLSRPFCTHTLSRLTLIDIKK